MAEERERPEAEEEKDDTEGHRRAGREDLTGKDDVEGHRRGRVEDLTGDEDDVEGHRWTKR